MSSGLLLVLLLSWLLLACCCGRLLPGAAADAAASGLSRGTLRRTSHRGDASTTTWEALSDQALCPTAGMRLQKSSSSASPSSSISSCLHGTQMVWMMILENNHLVNCDLPLPLNSLPCLAMVMRTESNRHAGEQQSCKVLNAGLKQCPCKTASTAHAL